MPKGIYIHKPCSPLHRANVSAAKIVHGHARSAALTPTYITWTHLRDRCHNSNHLYYYLYGGRGISVCERWNSFVNFLEDMGERPAGMEIDRINNEGNYEPGNCRWATHSENIRNRRAWGTAQ